MSELRWNALLGEWTVTATHRQDRTFLPPAEYCPLCPTRPGKAPTEVPAEDYDIVVFENRFPSFQTPPPDPAVGSHGIFHVKPAVGRCEVVLYTPEHSATLADASHEKLRRLIAVWTDRFTELSADDAIKYVLIFENKGEAMGVTLNHPHGQIYAYPFIPPVLTRELEESSSYFESERECMFCALIAAEKNDGVRVVGETGHFIAVVPFAARYPYEVHVYPKRHSGALPDLTPEERDDLTIMFKKLLTGFDALFAMPFPYVMAFHQTPVDGGAYDYYHWHIEFYPPMRTRDKLKILAGSELAGGLFINDTLPEEKAAELRAKWPQ